METLDLLLRTPHPPPFIYVHHPHQPTTSLAWPVAAHTTCRVDAIECHTPKLLWSAIASRLELAKGRTSTSSTEPGQVDSMDTFLRRLRAVGQAGGSANGHMANGTGGSRKGKGKATVNGHTDVAGSRGQRTGMCMSIVITKAERLPRVMGQTWTVMTRLAELVRLSALH